MPRLDVRKTNGGRIAVFEMDRPDAGNRIDRTFLERLRDACAAAGEDEALRAFVIGVRRPPFSLGWPDEVSGPALLELVELADSFRSVAGLRVPVLAAIEGEAVGAGAELTLACDTRVAGEDCSFRFPEVRDGRIPMAGGTQRLSRIVGRARAIEAVLWGEPIGATKAADIGLVNRVVPAGEALEAALSLAQEIASRGPLGVRFAREAVYRGADVPLEEGLRIETDLTVLLQSTEDRAEGVRAFLEKREPHFRGE